MTRRQFIVLGGFAAIGVAFTANQLFPAKIEHNLEIDYNETLAIIAQMIYAARTRPHGDTVFVIFRLMDNNKNTYHHDGYGEVFRFVWGNFIRRNFFMSRSHLNTWM